MGVFSRFTDIVNANVNSILDKAENPEKLVRLIVQEMEETLVDVRSHSAKYIADKKEINRQLTRLNGESAKWQENAELAIAKERDDLAKSALVEKHKVEEKIEVLQEELSKAEDALAALQEDTNKLQSKLEEAKQRQKSIMLRRNAASTRLQAKRQLHSVNIDHAIARFDNFERKVDELEAKVESYEMSNVTPLKAQFAELESEGKLDQELADLKAKVANG